ncbi:hypothetical protein AMYX_41890 [Anaeromyxobacter diazotrophicus]|uniref:Uncharacterized protein n=1 Tax=Anaeromyxobacter diazotrophicus TaxID=2590199 RepID=A0A7I9VT88_9BACT|nr:hypothetical protein AMYX_41890 [Anaeromyxobacter diazotrophicus]
MARAGADFSLRAEELRFLTGPLLLEAGAVQSETEAPRDPPSRVLRSLPPKRERPGPEGPRRRGSGYFRMPSWSMSVLYRFWSTVLR